MHATPLETTLTRAILLVGLSLTPAFATDSCDMSSNAAVRGCKMVARADRSVADGKCANLSDAAARAACNRQAAADARDAMATCADQAAFREAACDRLGDGPYDPVIDPANFVTVIDNPYFPLVPGTTFIYEGQTAAGFNHTEFEVTRNTKVLMGVTCVEIHDTVRLDGVLEEDTLDWFAQDRQGNIWYFGENTHELVDGLITTIAGSFQAGVDGAKPGIIMEAHPAIGDFYRQEFDLQNAEDDAEVVSLTASVTVPYGSFTGCLDTLETTPLEPDLHEHKFYAAGVGQVLTLDADSGERLPLVQITTH
jgi:hypothetical protein